MRCRCERRPQLNAQGGRELMNNNTELVSDSNADVGAIHEGVSKKRKPRPPSDVVWGAAAIGAEIGLAPSQAFYILKRGEIKCARQILGKKKDNGVMRGGRWVASRAALRAEFGLT